MAKKRIKTVELPLKSKKKLSKSTGITSPKKSAPKSTRSTKKSRVYQESRLPGGKGKRKSPPPIGKHFKKHPKGSAEDKAATLRRKRSAKLRAKSLAARAKAAKAAKAKKRGPIKQPKTRNPRRKGS